MIFFPRAASFEDLSARYGPCYRWLVLIVVGAGIVAGVLCTTSFGVAVPAMIRSFGLGQDQVQWAMTGFMLAMTLAMLPTSWLLDRFGFRCVFLTAVTMLAVASVGGYLSPDFTWVVCARILQGAATGIMQPLGVIAVMRLFPPQIQGRASGFLSFGIVLAPAVAPALGGLLLDRFGWQTIFLGALPFCLLALFSGLVLLPRSKDRASKGFDWAGSAMLTIATLSLVEATVSLQNQGFWAPWTLAMLAGTVVTLFFFVWYVRRAESPIISPRVFRLRSFAMGCVVSFAYGFGLYASSYLIPVFLQSALGFSATAAGFALIPSGVLLALTIPIAGNMADRLSPQWITAGGLGLFGLSFLLFATFGGRITHTELVGTTMLGRMGLGLILPALSLATLKHLDAGQLAESSVAISYTRQLGGVLGIAMTAVFVEWRESVYGRVAPGVYKAYSQSFLLLSLVFMLAVTAACFMKSNPRSVPLGS